ncbi:molybdopterin-guanine dinucleotide biosynthesis protein MobB [Erwiniaceae bacterium BAC15a-03b]|uniref:Molybdopterin-guanine dinucleotide biosynthesis protein MobB n=1 Tax=Winslowiella arboricola TaxID=2978220 RepID=A0A9J6PPI4_9GAMM|nr:molybdopterin-guanine dinucleotide biosynthesis protein MobB [Winslowiella arboricola]MCU5773468.1 molybdopterin-guanine dinucleotide biosynthesis protein MobB [Winslowiella arboricola]MCU5776620.1 molybdopterin-guanine dinucleotide biosynthesis protein MobB [Winslowiella arboricola]
MLPLIAFAAWSGTGKTTLLKQLIPLLKARNIRCGLIKHTHHQMDIDTPGKDSYQLRKAGADQVLVASQQRWALMTETADSQQPPDLHFLASRLDASLLDLVLVEGFKDEAVTKIVLWRQESGRDLNELLDQHVIAVASDRPLSLHIPSLDLNQPESIADFIVSRIKTL